MISWLQDLRYAIRQLRKSPGFSLTAIVTLALAIGANAVVFSVINGIILRPLNVPQAQNLYLIERASDKDTSQSYPDYIDFRERNRSFDDLAAFAIFEVALDTGRNPSLVWGEEASGNYFDALSIRPYLGRFFHASDEHGANSAPYIVLSYAFWHSRFHDDRGVVGRIVELNKHPFTILGVAPPEFRGTIVFAFPNFYVPIVNHEQLAAEAALNDRENRWIFMVIGHLKAGVTRAQATSDLNSIGSFLEKTYPKDERDTKFSLARPGLLGDQFGRPAQEFLAGLLLLSGLILLAACANLGSLFAARAADRGREVALRLALGSSRRRILRGLFTEAVLISLAGGAVGMWTAVLLLRWLSQWQPFGNFPIYIPVNPDATVYGLALLLSFISGFLFGVVPVNQVLRTNPYEVVKSGSSARVGRRMTVRDILLAVQIAICAVLVTSSLVAVRGLAHALHGNYGFEPRNAVLVGADLSMAGYSGNRVAPMQKRLIDAIAAIPGVEFAGLTDTLLLNGSNSSNVFTDKTIDMRASNAAASACIYHVSPEYLQAEGTTFLYGRALTWHDDKNSPRVAVVNREFARRLFGSAENAVGSYYKMPDGSRIQVIGIAEDGKYGSITEDPQAAMFLPILQYPSNSAWIVVRSRRDPQQLGTAIRSTLGQLDPGLPVQIEARYDEIGGALFPSQMAAVSLGVLGVMGAVLSITGIFGMAAYSVSKRLRELGIRVALGAPRKEVLKAALERAFKLLAFGSAAGLFLGILASKVLAVIVYEASPRDPLVMAGVVLAMSLVGLLATWIPARRALSIDPAILLREE
ncbi:ABC transporter permease [Alloacidobacterium dinghuense]|uniref:ABC transporter permease n=1 Tax=Alloacidobacterium dinghuense TaxID=2763107 RepID=A0A7G8BDW2_9BACT|nr:ABC transporter permease [Alloacidobacterium dinghuense]QNI30732.1 ABC transporter permease [Alloacidobacterium dinghuense]